MQKTVRVPLLSELFGEIPFGRTILALYDPDAQYTALLTNIAADFLRAGGDLLYTVSSRPSGEIRQQFDMLGANVSEYESSDKAVVFDAYSAQMGISSAEKYQSEAMNLNELSIIMGKSAPQWPAGTLVITESFSNLAFNQENVFAKFSRKAVGIWRNQGTIMIAGLANGLHPPEFYQEMKLISDAVLEMKLVEHGGEFINTIRGRSMKGQNTDSRVRKVIFDKNMKATLQLLKS
ncbi:MAG: ATPase domain-containing protein [Candidatus Bathyarchaeia archaeon]|jgi:KaiC/GvpD/RAD55 family RecA-like ATPase